MKEDKFCKFPALTPLDVWFIIQLHNISHFKRILYEKEVSHFITSYNIWVLFSVMTELKIFYVCLWHIYEKGISIFYRIPSNWDAPGNEVETSFTF